MSIKKNMLPEIGLFIETADQVLNSNTVYIEFDVPLENFDVDNYIKALFLSGKFYDSFMQALEQERTNQQKTISAIEFKLLPISFFEFRKILVDMLAVQKVYFHNSPYRVNLSEKTIQFVVDDFIESSINSENPGPYSKNTTQIEKTWSFYSMPRNYINASEQEIEYLQNTKGQTYRPMSKVNNDNFLGDYFFYLGLDSFLVFHNDKKIVFLMTNGGD